MTHDGLAWLVHAPDLDYVENFQALAAVNLELRNSGPTVERMVRKAILEVDVGDFHGARASAETAVSLDEDSAEAHYQRGVACTLLALVKADAIPGGPGHAEVPNQSVRLLLKEACASFKEAVRCNDHDTEADDRLARVSQVLKQSDDAKLEAALRGEAEPKAA